MPKVREIPEFNKCVGKLKKFRNIDKDIITFKQALKGYFPEQIPRTEIIPGFGKDYCPVYKVKKFFSTDLKSNVKMRVIYIYDPYEDEIILIEIYFKGQREEHNKELIKKYLVKK
ncbi:MAG: hypothetical protein IIA85_01605 [Nanoarchaeota archaeon]|nr:hypothetical protein [Nanoarchaeota archaeon]